MGLAMLILCGVAVVSGVAVAIIFLVTGKPKDVQVPSEVADLREEVAHLREKIERLNEDVEQLRNKPKASGSTDIKG
jgi:beta-lactam-binding protein with PASTA domain